MPKQEVDERIYEALQRLSAHEAMCEERSKTVFNRLDAIESQLKTINSNMFVVAVMLLSGMAGVIITLLVG